MTSEEFAAAGIPPAKEEIQETDIPQLPEDNPTPAASGSKNHDEGEIRSEGEDIGGVDVDPKDLIAAKRSKSLSTSFGGVDVDPKDPREKILGVWMLIRKISLPRNAQSLWGI
jgi:hypothetical protein